jgi:hypothetical protein
MPNIHTVDMQLVGDLYEMGCGYVFEVCQRSLCTICRAGITRLDMLLRSVNTCPGCQ